MYHYIKIINISVCKSLDLRTDFCILGHKNTIFDTLLQKNGLLLQTIEKNFYLRYNLFKGIICLEVYNGKNN